MVPAIPWFITLAVVATNLAIAVAVWLVIAAGAERAGLTPDADRRVRLATGMALAVWLGLALLLAPAPRSVLGSDPYAISPLVPLFMLGSAAALIVALRASASFRAAIGAAPLALLHGVQLYRVIGVVFLMLLARGQLPAHFALPAAWGDIAIGLAAPVVAVALATKAPWASALATGWNVAGIVDLAVAVGMGTGVLVPLLSPGLGPRVPPAAAMGVFPLILVPTFAVPVSVMLHGLGLSRMVRERRAGARLIPTPAG